nr:MAG TPA: hypothetical protein [Caudoviricetes sp.]
MTGRGRLNLYDPSAKTSVGCISFFAHRIFEKLIKSSENKIK